MSKITCQVCSAQIHIVKKHLAEQHAGMSIEDYAVKFPEAPLLSERARTELERQLASKRSEVTADSTKKPFHELFNLGAVPAAMNAKGDPIPVTVLERDEEHAEFIPSMDPAYVYNIEVLKNVLMALDLRFNCYIWGEAGCGKTTVIENACAATQRPIIRVQHTLGTEESQIVGQRIARGGETPFEPGLLPMAMRNGWVYLADEYDFAVPHILAVYQPVLEGKPLVIKDADAEWRVVKPHPNFRFFATGNTNGTGDDTGLYQGTQIQNAANYERFAIVLHHPQMDLDVEVGMLQKQVGLAAQDAQNLVRFDGMVREERAKHKVSIPISVRALINAGRIGMKRGSLMKGLELAYINRLPTIERAVATAVAQRVFGS